MSTTREGPYALVGLEYEDMKTALIKAVSGSTSPLRDCCPRKMNEQGSEGQAGTGYSVLQQEDSPAEEAIKSTKQRREEEGASTRLLSIQRRDDSGGQAGAAEAVRKEGSSRCVG